MIRILLIATVMCGAGSSDTDTLGDLAAQLPAVTQAAGVVDLDLDGVPDSEDAFPMNVRETHDSDGDGVGDHADMFPYDPHETRDSDCDGIGDVEDATFDGPVTAHVDFIDFYTLAGGTYNVKYARYDLTSTGEGQFRIDVQIGVGVPEGLERDPEAEARWADAIGRMWNRYGLRVHTTFVDAVEAQGYDALVALMPGEGRSAEGYWYMDSVNNLTVVHEVGHILGLDDEYEEEGRPDHYLGEPDNIMRVAWPLPRMVTLPSGETITTYRYPRPYRRQIDQIVGEFSCQ